MATILGARPASAQVEYYPRRDSILIMRDLDGDGRMDHVVLEVRRTANGAIENRVAVYLGQAPRARRPQWASSWEYEGVGEHHVDSLSITRDVGLLDIAFEGGDGDDHTILLVRGGKAQVEIEHRIDYGAGYLTVRRDGSAVIIDASVENLVLRRRELRAGAPCGASQWAMIRLHYDRGGRRFVPGARFCVNAQ